MPKSKNLIVLSAAMLLMACTPKPTPAPTSSSTTEVSKSENSEKGEEQLISSAITSNKTDESITSSVEPVIDGVTFDKFAKIITDAAYIEAKLSTGGTYKSVDTAGSISDTVEYTLDVYDDFSSYATGTVKETRTDGSKINEDSFIERKAIKATQFRDLGIVYDYTMLYSIKDYKEDSFAKNAYKDSVSRQIIDDDASQDGVINTTVAKWELTLQATNSVIAFFDQYFYSNMYVDQLGINSVHEDVTEENTIYTISAEYKVDGDLNDVITYHNELEVTMDKNKSRVLSYKTNTYSDDVSKKNPEDRYFSGTRTEVSVEYGEKDSAPVEVPNVDDYFLASIDEVCVLDAQRKEVDLIAVAPSAGFLYVTPKTYSPATAMGITEWTTVPEATSDESIIKIHGATSSNPCFEVVGQGKCELTYSYLGRDSKGVYEKRLGTVEVNIREFDYPTSVSVSYVYEVETGEQITGWDDAKLSVQRTYKVPYVVKGDPHAYINKAPQAVKVTSSNEDVLGYYYKDGDLYLEPKKEGKATIRIASEEFPDIYWEREFEVFEDKGTDLKDLLTSHRWRYYSSAWGTDWTMEFKADGSGIFIEIGTESGKEYREAFKWTLDGDVIKTSNWTYDYGIVNGTFDAGLESISFYIEKAVKTYSFGMIK